MGLSRNVSEIDGDFSRKSQKFSTPCILRPRWRFPLELGISARSQRKTRMMELPGWETSFAISPAVWIQYTNMSDRQTDGHRTTAKTALTH